MLTSVSILKAHLRLKHLMQTDNYSEVRCRRGHLPFGEFHNDDSGA